MECTALNPPPPGTSDFLETECTAPSWSSRAVVPPGGVRPDTGSETRWKLISLLRAPLPSHPWTLRPPFSGRQCVCVRARVCARVHRRVLNSASACRGKQT